MDNDLKQIESELRLLKPRGLSPSAVRRMQAEMKSPQSSASRMVPFPRSLSWRLLGPAIAVAAMLLISVGVFLKTSPPGDEERAAATPATGVSSVAYGTAVLDQRDEGVVSMADRTPVRKVRYTLEDRMQWHDRQSGGTFSARVPRQEVVLVSLRVD
jgi:hypothetical protein